MRLRMMMIMMMMMRMIVCLKTFVLVFVSKMKCLNMDVVSKGMLHAGYLPACVHRMLPSAPKAWPSSSSHSIAASPLASVVANVHGPCGAVCLQTMPVDVDGDADVAGLAGDALHGRADTGPAFAHDLDHDVDDCEEADGDISMRDITTT